MLFPQKIKVVANARHLNPHHEIVVVQNDTAVEFLVAVIGDNGQTSLPSETSYVLTSLHVRKRPTQKLGVMQEDGNILFDLDQAELGKTGTVQAYIQAYHPEKGRVTSHPFTYHVAPDPIYGAEIRPPDKSLIEQVIGEGPAIIAEAKMETELNITERARLTDVVTGLATKESVNQVVAQLADKAEQTTVDSIDKQIKKVPISVLESGTISKSIEDFLNQQSNTKVVFPYGLSVVLDRQIVVHHVNNLVVDFNGMNFIIPNSVAWTSRSDVSPYSVTTTAFNFFDSENIEINNLSIDGNRSNQINTKQCMGIKIENVINFKTSNLNIKEMNYHAIYLSTGTKGAQFHNTELYNIGLSSGGYSDVYISNSETDDYAFYNTRSERSDLLTDNFGQVFYVNGHNGFIKDVFCKNVAVIIDCRMGKHFVENIIVDGCRAPFTVQSTSSNTRHPSLSIKGVSATNVYGSDTGGAALIYIIACDRLIMEDISVKGAVNATNNWYGLRIRKFDQRPIKNVFIKNLSIEGVATGGIRTEALDSPINLEGISIIGKGTGVAMTSEGDVANVFLKNYSFTGFNNNGFAGTTSHKIAPNNEYPTIGTTANRPTGISSRQIHQYYDTTLSKMITWNGVTWIDSTGATA